MTPIQRVDVLRAACCVAGADQLVDEKEMVIIRKLAKDVGIGTTSLDAMISRAESDSSFCHDQFRFLKENPSECIAIMMEVAAVDGKVGDEEQLVLTKLASNLGISDEIFAQILERTRRHVDGG